MRAIQKIQRAIQVASFGMSLALGGCGTTVGNGLTEPVGVGFKAFQLQSGALMAVDPRLAAGQIQTLTICFKRIRFKGAPGDSGGQNVDLRIGEVTLSPQGTTLQNVTVPAGTYRRIEFDIDDKTCPSNRSIHVTNTNGTFDTKDSITIRFEGNITITGTQQSLFLNIQTVVSALANVTSGNQIKDAAEGADGDFDDK